MTENYDLKTALEEIKRAYEGNSGGFELQRNTARFILQVSSLLVGLYNLFQISKPTIIPEDLLPLRPWVLIVLYLALVIAVIHLLRPANAYGPIDMNWLKIDQAFVGKSEEEILLQQCSNYLNALHENEKVLNFRRKILNGAIIFQVLIVIIIVL